MPYAKYVTPFQGSRHKNFLVLCSEFFVQKKININSYLWGIAGFAVEIFDQKQDIAKSIYGKSKPQDFEVLRFWDSEFL